MNSNRPDSDSIAPIIAMLEPAESRVQLLQQIDQDVRAIFGGAGSLDTVIYNAIKNLLSVVDVDHAELLIGLSGNWIKIHSFGSGNKDWSYVLSRWYEQGRLPEESKSIIIFPKSEDSHPYIEGIPAVLLNIFRLSASNRNVAIVMEAHDFTRAEKFLDSKILQIMDAVSVQIQNAFELNVLARKRLSDSQILEAFFNKNLKPSQCLAELAFQIQGALPSLRALALDPPPEVQILLYNPGDKFLTIRATTGSEINVTRLKVEDSVCGYLIEDSSLDYYVCDPQIEPRYKWYLGREESRRMRSELAVPIRDESNQVVGVLNLESEKINAFTPLFIQSVCRRAAEFCVWILAIRDRLEIGWAKEYALNTVMTGYITGFSRLIRHNVGNAANAVVHNTEVAIKSAELHGANLNKEVTDHLDIAIKNGKQVIDILDSFVDDLKDFSGHRGHSIKQLISSAVAVITDRYNLYCNLDPDIVIPDALGDDCKVFCSKVFRQHIINVLENSVVWIKERLKTQSDPKGVIVIGISSFTTGIVDQEREFNRRCQITIRDNGTGVQPELLDQLRAFEDRTTYRLGEDGHGYGLFALRQYLNSINGWVDIDSKFGEYFEVKILLDIFNPVIHTGG